MFKTVNSSNTLLKNRPFQTSKTYLSAHGTNWHPYGPTPSHKLKHCITHASSHTYTRSYKILAWQCLLFFFFFIFLLYLVLKETHAQTHSKPVNFIHAFHVSWVIFVLVLYLRRRRRCRLYTIHCTVLYSQFSIRARFCFIFQSSVLVGKAFQLDRIVNFVLGFENCVFTILDKQQQKKYIKTIQVQ